MFPAMSEKERGSGVSLRASDEDRERFAAELRTHAVAGRLSTDELEERLQQAYEARTLGDLEALHRDLPATPESLALARREHRARLVRRSIQESGGSLGAFVVCAGIWAAGGASGAFWPIWVLIPFVLFAVRSGWDLFGPAGDLHAVETRLDARARERADQRRRRRRR